MENKTAVEWVFEKMAQTPITDWYKVREEAISMEKEQIKEGYIMSLLDSDNKIRRDAEDYYNETYNK